MLWGHALPTITREGEDIQSILHGLQYCLRTDALRALQETQVGQNYVITSWPNSNHGEILFDDDYIPFECYFTFLAMLFLSIDLSGWKDRPVHMLRTLVSETWLAVKIEQGLMHHKFLHRPRPLFRYHIAQNGANGLNGMDDSNGANNMN
ncbi:unnamed protein product, partial [Fusarium graminearum]